MIFISFKKVAVGLIVAGIVCCGTATARAETLDSPQTIVAYSLNAEGSEYLQEGYIDKDVWQEEFDSQSQELQQIYSELLDLRDYLSEENAAIIDNFDIENFNYIEELKNTKEEFVIMRDEALAAKERQLEQQRQKRNAQEQSYNSNASSFKSQGVIYQNGIRYTYYSSNVLYHYRTPEWTAGADGIYRDSSGYIIVASSDYRQGTIVPTPFGQGKVYDSGCASGTIDIYTNF